MLNKIFNLLSITLLSIVLFCAVPASAQDVSVSAKMDSTAMIIGHQTKMTLELTKPADAIINFPLVLDTLVDKVEVIGRSDIDTVFLGNNREVLTQEFLVTSFDSGFYYIPPMEFEIQNGGGVLETNPMVLKMYTYQIDSIQGICDLKPVKDIPYKFSEFSTALLILFGLIILVGLGLYFYSRHKQNKPMFTAPPKPKEPAYITAFRELERIKGEKLWQAGKEKEYFTELSDTLRGYLEGRFDVVAMEQTSDEILVAIKDKVDKADYKRIEDILKLSDLVKFAKMKPMLNESELCIKEVYAFVDKTKFVPELEETEEEESTDGTTEKE